MSKRRITQQQSSRIAKKQQAYLEKSQTQLDNLESGLVITRFTKHAIIESSAGKLFYCAIRPHVNTLVAGDEVIWQPTSSQHGVVVSLQPRQSLLGRPNKQGALKAIAANITQLLIVVAPKPAISWSLLDSYLIMSEQLQLKACIVLNKLDLEHEALKRQLLAIYSPLDYPILFTAQGDKKGLKQLINQLRQESNIFVGQSGVGKSSLIQTILPNQSIQTAPISTISELGCHTTSNAYLYHLTGGGILIDSPGVREFGLWEVAPADLAKGYREFKPYLNHCKFRNCNHYKIPGCAVIEAMHNHAISQQRYENYVKLIQQYTR